MTVIVERRGRSVATRRLKSNLEILVTRPGGTRRDEAIAEADRRVEAMRGSSMNAIQGLVETLDRDSVTATDGAQFAAIQRLTGQIITLSETFGLTFMAEVTKRLCDFVHTSQDKGVFDREVLAIHINAVRLCSPKQKGLSAAAAKAMLNELDTLSSHIGVKRPG